MAPDNPQVEAANMRRLYREAAASDFFTDVLARWAPNLLVLRLDKSGWSDLGTPERVIERMAQIGISTSWWEPPALGLDPVISRTEQALEVNSQAG